MLAEKGADVIVIAGVKDNMDYAGFSETYVNQSNKYLTAVKVFVDKDFGKLMITYERVYQNKKNI